MIKKRQIAEDLQGKLEKAGHLELDEFERELLEDLLEKFVREEKTKEETERINRKQSG